MKVQEAGCAVDAAADFLQAKLSDEEVLEFERHLSECECCRETLATMTADHATWTKVGNLLRDEIDDAPPLTCLYDADGEQVTSHRAEAVIDLLEPSDDPTVLGKLDQYEIGEVIGVGGMGVVLKAVDPGLNRVVAIKVMAPVLAISPDARKRFSREAKAAASVKHENVIEIFGISEFKQLPYLVMPYSPGASLQTHIEQNGPLPLAGVLQVGIQIASGLAAAHDRGLVHRDIKPANILLNDGVDRITITDFGLARAVDDGSLTRTGIVSGTPQYMSPEQARGDAVDARSDLFSLGSLLYFACTGKVPFQAESTFGTMRRISDFEPASLRAANLNVPEWFAKLLGTLMEKSPAERYQSAHEVAEHMRQCSSHLRSHKSPLPASLRPSKRRFGLVMALAMLFVSSSIMFGAWAIPEENQTKQPSDQQQEKVAQNQQQIIPLKGHNLAVYGVAIDRNSEIVATGSDDRLIRMFSVSDGTLIRTIPGHNGRVNRLDFHPQKDQLLTAGFDKTVRVWDIKSGKELLKIDGYERHVNDAEFSPSGETIAVATWEKTVDIINAKTGKKLKSLYVDRGRNFVEFSPDGALIVSGGWDNKTFVWSTKTYELLTVLEQHRGAIYHGCFSPDGKWFATASHDSTVLIWDVKTWKPKTVLDNEAGSMTSV